MKENEYINYQMYEWACDLFPIHRSLTGNGVRETIHYLRKIVPEFQVHEVSTGTKFYDWVVPNEWNVSDAYIVGPDGNKFAEFHVNNLHLVGYSEPIIAELSLDDLLDHLYSSEEQPDAIPYITSYYKRRWGFCISHNKKLSLVPGNYKVVIESSLEPGSLTYTDLVLPGTTDKEILFTSYICHPSMANNELSGPVVLIALADWLKSQKSRKYTYRFVLAPETLGSIVYINQHLEVLKKNVLAGYVITCVGDDRGYSFLPSRSGTTLADRVARNVLKYHYPNYKEYDFLERGSDERQYCFPTVDLPVASVMRSKYDNYPEYHTSLDNLELISAKGLGGSLSVYKKIVSVIEHNNTYKVNTLCEPRLGIRNLYPDLSRKEIYPSIAAILNVLAFSDGYSDLISISDRIGVSFDSCLDITNSLSREGLLDLISRE